jgi:hypothetical protein
MERHAREEISLRALRKIFFPGGLEIGPRLFEGFGRAVDVAAVVRRRIKTAVPTPSNFRTSWGVLRLLKAGSFEIFGYAVPSVASAPFRPFNQKSRRK